MKSENASVFNMKHVKKFKVYKLPLISIFSFLLGCMLTINLVPIDKTCKIEDTDREFNIMKNSKLKNPELIVLIMSAPKNLMKRNTVRETWLKLKDRGIVIEDESVKFKMKHYFVIGSLGLTPDDILHLSSEQSEFSDILILPIHDSYNNLTIKVAKSFEWLSDQYDFGLCFKYVLKCDDDSFVRIDNLIHEIRHLEIVYLKSELKQVFSSVRDNSLPYFRLNIQTNNKNEVHNSLQLYWGYFSGKAKIKTAGKWKESDYIACDRYIPYALGGGYILSKELVSYIGKNSGNLRLFNSEDVSVGFWLSPVNNILRVHDIRFDTEWTSRGCQNTNLITHNISTEEMQVMYENILQMENMCSQEVLKRDYYFYNWTAPASQCCMPKKITS